MTALSSGLDYVDLHFLGLEHVIATAVLHDVGGVALIDPGPTTTLERLKSELAARGMTIGDVRALLLTHIHLDHAGVTGHLVRENPQMAVYVHEVGAPHLVDPSKLLASAAKLYGADMERLWGEVLPVPAANVRVLKGGERLTEAGRTFQVMYTPGHAKHHVSFFDARSEMAFVGDTLGIRRAPSTYVLPPTPPPDIDLTAWSRSVDHILGWNPDTIFITHFGPFDDARVHADELIERLHHWATRARALLRQTNLTDDQRRDTFVDEVLLDLRRQMPPTDADAYDKSGRVDYSWVGLARAMRKEQPARA
jgi:glyoxylase-like metal-dependent hydrolase (beta-lactamase superfamily II)